jgi:hypothetical protein
MSTRPYPKDLTIRCLDGVLYCHRIDLMRGSDYFKKRFEFNMETEDVIEEPISVEHMNIIIKFTDPTISSIVGLEVSIEMFQCIDYYCVPNFIKHVRKQLHSGNTDLIMSNLEYFSESGTFLLNEVAEYLRKELFNCKRELYFTSDDSQTQINNEQEYEECIITVLKYLIIAWKHKCVVLVKCCMDMLCGRYREAKNNDAKLINKLIPFVFVENVPNDIKEALVERLTRTPIENEDPMYFTNMILSK